MKTAAAMTFDKSTRSYFFRALVAAYDRKIFAAGKGPMVLTWREARLIFKGATVAAIYRLQQEGNARSFGRRLDINPEPTP